MHKVKITDFSSPVSINNICYVFWTEFNQITMFQSDIEYIPLKLHLETFFYVVNDFFFLWQGDAVQNNKFLNSQLKKIIYKKPKGKPSRSYVDSIVLSGNR
jgi:hypothetical protein